MPLLVVVLALAAFAQGTSEFMLAGLLSPIAVDLDVSLSSAGALTAAFAAGMVVGAPLVAAFGARIPPRRSLIALLTVFIAVHVAGALVDAFALLLATRVIAALANAGFLAIALAAVRRLVTPAMVTPAVSMLLGGITVATIVGVPAGAALASWMGRRAPFWAVAIVCLPAVVALLLDRSLGNAQAPPPFEARRECAELGRTAVAVPILLAMLVNAGTFGVFTYLAVLGDAVGVTAEATPLLLAVFGVGSFLGVTAAGRWAGPRAGRWMLTGTCGLVAVWGMWAMVAASPAALFAGAGVGGFVAFATGSALIGRTVRAATGAPVLGGAFATAALNVGASAGPLLAGGALERFGGPGVPASAMILAALAAVLAFGARSALR